MLMGRKTGTGRVNVTPGPETPPFDFGTQRLLGQRTLMLGVPMLNCHGDLEYARVRIVAI